MFHYTFPYILFKYKIYKTVIIKFMRKKVVIVGSAGNFGKYIFNELKKTNNVLGIERKKSKNNFECKDLSNSKMNFETFKLIKRKNPNYFKL